MCPFSFSDEFKHTFKTIVEYYWSGDARKYHPSGELFVVTWNLDVLGQDFDTDCFRDDIILPTLVKLCHSRIRQALHAQQDAVLATDDTGVMQLVKALAKSLFQEKDVHDWVNSPAHEFTWAQCQPFLEHLVMEAIAANKNKKKNGNTQNNLYVWVRVCHVHRALSTCLCGR
jgi:hypothetical protein